ncbi:MAG TPA: RDD family protein [Pyrinomonadaceae bacterium]|jgi:uncharacterized RDD family membrane protein YckC
MEKYQTFFSRIVAYLVDSFILLPLAILDDWFRQAEFPRLFFYFWLPLSALVAPVYRIAMHAAGGQTLGKMALGVKVLSADEKLLTLKQAVVRESPQLLINFGLVYLGIAFFGADPEAENVKAATAPIAALVMLWSLVDVLCFLFDIKRRALHDFIAGTVVVKANARD